MLRWKRPTPADAISGIDTESSVIDHILGRLLAAVYIFLPGIRTSIREQISIPDNYSLSSIKTVEAARRMCFFFANHGSKLPQLLANDRPKAHKRQPLRGFFSIRPKREPAIRPVFVNANSSLWKCAPYRLGGRLVHLEYLLRIAAAREMRAVEAARLLPMLT